MGWFHTAAHRRTFGRFAIMVSRRPLRPLDPALPENLERGCDQQAAYQPAGNGISGQAGWLSLAALGGGLYFAA